MLYILRRKLKMYQVNINCTVIGWIMFPQKECTEVPIPSICDCDLILKPNRALWGSQAQKPLCSSFLVGKTPASRTFHWVPKDRFKQLLIKGGAAKKPPEVRLKETSAVLCLVTQWCLTLCNPIIVASQAPLSMGFYRQEYWSGLPCPSPEIFPTQGSNPGLPHCGQILYHLSHHRSPRLLEWVPYPFSRGSSQSRNRTRVSWIAGRFFTRWDWGSSSRLRDRPPETLHTPLSANPPFNLCHETPHQTPLSWNT